MLLTQTGIFSLTLPKFPGWDSPRWPCKSIQQQHPTVLAWRKGSGGAWVLHSSGVAAGPPLHCNPFPLAVLGDRKDLGTSLVPHGSHPETREGSVVVIKTKALN